MCCFDVPIGAWTRGNTCSPLDLTRSWMNEWMESTGSMVGHSFWIGPWKVQYKHWTCMHACKQCKQHSLGQHSFNWKICILTAINMLAWILILGIEIRVYLPIAGQVHGLTALVWQLLIWLAPARETVMQILTFHITSTLLSLCDRIAQWTWKL